MVEKLPWINQNFSVLHLKSFKSVNYSNSDELKMKIHISNICGSARFTNILCYGSTHVGKNVCVWQFMFWSNFGSSHLLVNPPVMICLKLNLLLTIPYTGFTFLSFLRRHFFTLSGRNIVRPRFHACNTCFNIRLKVWIASILATMLECRFQLSNTFSNTSLHYNVTSSITFPRKRVAKTRSLIYVVLFILRSGLYMQI